MQNEQHYENHIHTHSKDHSLFTCEKSSIYYKVLDFSSKISKNYQ